MTVITLMGALIEKACEKINPTSGKDISREESNRSAITAGNLQRRCDSVTNSPEVSVKFPKVHAILPDRKADPRISTNVEMPENELVGFRDIRRGAVPKAKSGPAYRAPSTCIKIFTAPEAWLGARHEIKVEEVKVT
jgi:hypothetical protein